MPSSESEFRVQDQAISCKFRHSLPLVYTASVDEVGKRWEGRAIIPSSYFPPNVTLFNAYAIHGVGESRRKVDISWKREILIKITGTKLYMNPLGQLLTSID